MTVEKITYQRIKKAFSGWLIQDVGIHTLPVNATPYERNMRIVNGTATRRKGYTEELTWSTGTKVQWLVSNWWTLYAVYGSEMFSLDLDANSDTQVSTISLPSDSKVHFVTFGKYIIVLTGEWYPFVYDGTTWSQTSSSNIESGANPRFGTVFAKFTLVAWGWAKKNHLYISRWITATNTAYSYDRTGTGSEIIYMNSDIKAVKSTLNRVFVFTEKSVEYLDRTSITEISWVTSFYTQPIANDNIPASNNAVVVANDRIFFFTATRGVKTINYISGVTELEIGNLSGRKDASIEWFLSWLDQDQSDCEWFFNKDSNTVEWHLKTNWSPFNNIVLVYDIEHDSFHVDDNKFINTMTYHNDKIYGGSHIGLQVYEMNTGNDDDDLAITWRRDTAQLTLWDPMRRKQIRYVGIFWEVNNQASIKVNVVVDGSTVAGPYTISGSEMWVAWLWSTQIAQVPIAGETSSVSLVPFEKIIGRWELRYKWYRLQLSFSWWTVWEEFTLSWIEVWYRVLPQQERTNKVYISQATLVWILATGARNDAGVRDDTDTWQDS